MFVIFYLFHFLPNLPLSSKSSAEEMEKNEFLPLSSTRPEESHFFRKKLNPDFNAAKKSCVPFEMQTPFFQKSSDKF